MTACGTLLFTKARSRTFYTVTKKPFINAVNANTVSEFVLKHYRICKNKVTQCIALLFIMVFPCFVIAASMP